MLLTRLENRKVFADVEWETLVFFAGLFIMVGALVNLGIIDSVGKAAVAAVGDNFFGPAIGLLAGSAVFSGIVGNIPYVARTSWFWASRNAMDIRSRFGNLRSTG